jgi:hypothetical protein
MMGAKAVFLIPPISVNISSSDFKVRIVRTGKDCSCQRGQRGQGSAV